ncbi:MAG: beta-lactamase family protein [Actinobacteria bacterium]|nr:beta-lactamase family protein [Actinomycetota bacterium]
MSSGSARMLAGLIAVALLVACAPDRERAPLDPLPSSIESSAPSTSATTPDASTPGSSSSTTGEPTTVAPTTEVPPSSAVPPTSGPAEPITYAALHVAAAGLVEGNVGVSVSVWRHGSREFAFTGGTRTDGSAVDSDSQFVIASVSKLVTALSVARLAQQGRVQLDGPVPWSELGVPHDPAWESVTVRQLLSHTSGMPEARATWLDDPGPCRVPLVGAVAAPPTPDLGTWHYSNGNYCALGILVEDVTGLDLEAAAYELVFDPSGISGPFLSTEGPRASSVPYTKGLARLERLGGAGTWLASTDDIAAMLSAVTADDLETLRWPGIILDQYGWGHTGSVDGAAACAWVLQGGDIVVTAFVSGTRPSSGGKVCDVVVPALATDLGSFAGDPVRTPD